jgi:hypothetical protein
MEKKPAPTIRDLYPHLSEQELAVAADNLERYLALVLRFFDRMKDNPQADHLTANPGTLSCTPPPKAST